METDLMPLEYQTQQTSRNTIPPCSEHMQQFLKNYPLFSYQGMRAKLFQKNLSFLFYK
jgi:hypothetical protein